MGGIGEMKNGNFFVKSNNKIEVVTDNGPLGESFFFAKQGFLFFSGFILGFGRSYPVGAGSGKP